MYANWLHMVKAVQVDDVFLKAHTNFNFDPMRENNPFTSIGFSSVNLRPYNTARSGLRGMEQYSPDTGKWLQAGGYGLCPFLVGRPRSKPSFLE